MRGPRFRTLSEPFKEPRNRFPVWWNRFLGSINDYINELWITNIEYKWALPSTAVGRFELKITLLYAAKNTHTILSEIIYFVANNLLFQHLTKFLFFTKRVANLSQKVVGDGGTYMLM
jgi:hypothetical protein